MSPNRYRGKRKRLGLALSTARRHPYGKGAAKLNPKTLVEKGRKGGASEKLVAKELQAKANINKGRNPKVYRKFSKAASIARKMAHRKKQYAKDKVTNKN
ncbi:MAG: hypothetical protein KGI06_02740 [Candidatus Micrarchaeota archaeon]|nr:hypothetical protein [Candidatus Micrarchaeota archaeon]